MSPTPHLPLSLTVNGEDHHLMVEPRRTLLDLLRHDLGLTGAKKVCDMGNCGACTVSLDGRTVYACLTLAVDCEGKQVRTIEGLAQGTELDPVQKAFVEEDAFQCGYCTPGQICSAAGLLAEAEAGWPSAVTPPDTTAPTLDAEEIRERISGNLCRCGAYQGIVAAVESVAKARELDRTRKRRDATP